MSEHTRVIRLGRIIAGLSMVMAVTGMVVSVASGRWELAWEVFGPVNALVGFGFGALVWTALPSHPRNGSIWAYAVAAFSGGLFCACLAIFVLTAPGALLDMGVEDTIVPAELSALPALAVGIMITAWIPGLFLPMTFGLLLFPDGRLPSRRWRPLAWYLGLAFAITVVSNLVLYNRWSTVAIGSYETNIGSFVELALVSVQLGALMSVASVVARYRRAPNVVRQQIKWIALGGAALLIGEVAYFFLWAGLDIEPDATLSNLLNLSPLVPFIAAFWIAVVRHNLFDIDVILSKSVMYLGLLAAITAVYAAVVVGPLLVLGRSDTGDGPGLLLPIVATGVVAVLFEPIRSRMQRWANRLVYGDRATPHEVLSQVTSGLTEGQNIDDLARLMAEGTGADTAAVWLERGGAFERAGSWSNNGSLPELPPASDERSEVLEVRHEAEVLGAVSVTKPTNDPITPADRELLDDVAASAGLLLRNIRLNRELEDRAVEVRDSRRRLIEAQDLERHRLERDLHDGAQQQVVALKVKLGIAKTVAQREGADTIADGIVSLAGDTQDAVDALRRVAHGIYPPLLESEGLEPALRAVERTSEIPIELDATDLDRYGKAAEQTIYFCVTETLERARMSGATGARVGVVGRNGDLISEIDLGELDAELDLRAIADRLDAAGGSLTVENRGAGALIVESIPVTSGTRAST